MKLNYFNYKTLPMLMLWEYHIRLDVQGWSVLIWKDPKIYVLKKIINSDDLSQNMGFLGVLTFFNLNPPSNEYTILSVYMCWNKNCFRMTPLEIWVFGCTEILNLKPHWKNTSFYQYYLLFRKKKKKTAKGNIQFVL